MARSLRALALAILSLASVGSTIATPVATGADGAADAHASLGTTRRETLEEAAVHARELLQYRSDGIGTLASVFPADYPDDDLAGLSIALQEYFAVYPNGDLVLLAMPIAKTFHNALITPQRRLTFTVKDEVAEREDGKMWAANRRRVSMWGTLRRLEGKEADEARALYDAEHPDAPFWDGENGPHYSFWVRFEVYRIYYFGGFGDRAAIGYLDMDLYRSSTPAQSSTTSPPLPALGVLALRKGKALAPNDAHDSPLVLQRNEN